MTVAHDCLDGVLTPRTGQLWVRKLHRRITLYYENLIVADSKDVLCTVEIDPDLREPVIYLPPSDVIADLTPNGLRETCDLKGDATYFDLLDTNGTLIAKNAAWSFPNPTPRAAQIRNCIAFTNRYFTFEDLPL